MIKHYSLTLLLLLSSTLLFAQQNVFPGKQAKQAGHTPMTITPVMINGAAKPMVYSGMVTQPYSPLVFPRSLPQGPQQKPWEITLTRDPDNGMPIAVRFAEGSFDSYANEKEATTLVPEIFNSIGYIFGLDADTEMKVVKAETDELGYMHIKLQQMHQGLEVFGAQLILHLYPDGSALLNGRNQPSPNITQITPTLDADAAHNAAVIDVAQRDYYRPLTDTEKDLLHQHAPRLIVYPARNQFGKFNLAWHVTVHNTFVKVWEYFIDAHTGEVLNAYDHTCSVGPTTATATDLMGASRTINTFEAPNNSFFLIDASRIMYNGPTNALPTTGNGSIVTLTLQNTSTASPNAADLVTVNNVWSNPTAVSAHANAGIAYEYFRTVHGRNSINGQGGDVVSFIDVADENGQSMDNAFWNGQFMFYGNGRQSFNRPLARSLDVGGHEMSHGVIQNTANLVYQDESGALNESFADVFGVMIDRTNWILGEDVVNPAIFSTGALRNMQDPHNGGSSLNDAGWQPKHVNEQYTGSANNGGVHINSGIPNHAFYLYATATSKEIAEKVWYRALAQYLTKSSKFVDLRIAITQAATDLHGAGSAQVNAVGPAFNAVGIGGGSGTNTNPTLPVNPGGDFILFTDVNPQDPTTLYITNQDTSSFTAISNIGVNFRPSVVDDGSVALFVSTAKNLHVAGLEPGNLFNNQLTNDNFFQTAAVSKDGTKMAAISVNLDTSIYVYDFGTQLWGKFRLYNPTTGQGINIAGVRFAEALEWDYSGQYLVYDAYNEIPGTAGYWDVGFINVWNNATNTWGDGTITKLFTGLPFGISIGNPSFSKNSPNVLAFDAYDANSNVYSVLGANIETGDVGTIWQQSVVGTPSYSKNDNRMVFGGRDQSNTIDLIGIVNLNPNKITPSGQPAVFLNNAIWPVWYSTGTRNIDVGVEDRYVPTWTAMAFPNPFNSDITVNLSGLSKPGQTFNLTLYNLMGQLVYETDGQTSGNHHTVTLSPQELPAGYYLLKVGSGNEVKTLKVVKN